MSANVSTSSAVHRTYSFGEFTLDLDRGALLRAGTDIKLRPKSFEVLSYLVERQGFLVTRDELLDAIWGRTVVTEDAITQCLRDIRRALRDQSQEMVRTVPRRGYIFELPVTKHGGPVTAPDRPSRTRFTTSWPDWRLAAALVLILGVAAVWWGFGNRRVDVATMVEPLSIVAPHSIAVLPFVNMSSDPEQEYFSDGISEEILNLLAKVQELRVTSRSSAFSFKGQNVDISTIAAKLNVAYVLDGSVRKSGNELRVAAQLIDVATDTHLWSDTYDRELKNVFAVQDEIAAAVVGALKIKVLGDEPKATRTNPEAYALYLQGRYFLYKYTGEDRKRGETLLNQALEIDPEFAPAWTALAFMHFWYDEENGWIELTRDLLERALEIDPRYARAYALLARLEMEAEWDLTAAYQHQQQALALDPGDAVVLRWAGWTEFNFGRIDEAIDLTQRSIALDPVSFPAYLSLGYILYCAHRLEEAADSFQMAISLNPGGQFTHALFGRVLLAQGDAPAALTLMEKETNVYQRLGGTAIVQHALGDVGASDAALKALIETGAAIGVAEAYAFRGEIDKAFDWLHQAYDEHVWPSPHWLRDPLFANLHDDPRWEAFLDKLGLPH